MRMRFPLGRPAVVRAVVLGVLPTLLGSRVAVGQTDLEQALAECAQISLERARLACFDAVMSEAADAHEAAPPAVEREAAVTPPPASIEPPPPAEPSRPVAAPAAAAEPAEPESSGEPVTVTVDPPEGLDIVVARVRTDQLGRRSFVTADGRVFDQISARKYRYPDEPFGATLQQASRNSFFLRAVGRRQSVRVTERD
jgi:hypothetical protein